jgi:hypothetical protein
MSASAIVGCGTFSTVFRGKLFGVDVAVKEFKNNGHSNEVKSEAIASARRCWSSRLTGWCKRKE